MEVEIDEGRDMYLLSETVLIIANVKHSCHSALPAGHVTAIDDIKHKGGPADSPPPPFHFLLG